MTGTLRFAPAFAAILLWLPCVANATSSRSASISDRFDSFVAIQLARQDLRPESIATSATISYDERFSEFDSPANIHALDDDDVEILFRATRLLAFYTMSPKHVAKIGLTVSELESRGLARRVHYAQLHGAYVSIRRFDLAIEISKRHRELELEALPNYVEMPESNKSARTWLSVTPGEDVLRREIVPAALADQLIVVAHPLCHFSTQAIVDITSDPVLSNLFLEHAVWLVPPGTSLDFAAMREWNRHHPNQPLHLAYQTQDWPELDYWGTPTFYFLRNGKVMKKVVGWPPDGGKGAILAGFSSAGLMKTSQ